MTKKIQAWTEESIMHWRLTPCTYVIEDWCHVGLGTYGIDRLLVTIKIFYHNLTYAYVTVKDIAELVVRRFP